MYIYIYISIYVHDSAIHFKLLWLNNSDTMKCNNDLQIYLLHLVVSSLNTRIKYIEKGYGFGIANERERKKIAMRYCHILSTPLLLVSSLCTTTSFSQCI